MNDNQIKEYYNISNNILSVINYKKLNVKKIKPIKSSEIEIKKEEIPEKITEEEEQENIIKEEEKLNEEEIQEENKEKIEGEKKKIFYKSYYLNHEYKKKIQYEKVLDTFIKKDELLIRKKINNVEIFSEKEEEEGETIYYLGNNPSFKLYLDVDETENVDISDGLSNLILFSPTLEQKEIFMNYIMRMDKFVKKAEDTLIPFKKSERNNFKKFLREICDDLLVDFYSERKINFTYKKRSDFKEKYELKYEHLYDDILKQVSSYKQMIEFSPKIKNGAIIYAFEYIQNDTKYEIDNSYIFDTLIFATWNINSALLALHKLGFDKKTLWILTLNSDNENNNNCLFSEIFYKEEQEFCPIYLPMFLQVYINAIENNVRIPYFENDEESKGEKKIDIFNFKYNVIHADIDKLQNEDFINED